MEYCARRPTFHKMTLLKEVGGLGAPPLASTIVQEDLAVGDTGIASHLLETMQGVIVVR